MHTSMHTTTEAKTDFAVVVKSIGYFGEGKSHYYEVNFNEFPSFKIQDTAKELQDHAAKSQDALADAAAFAETAVIDGPSSALGPVCVQRRPRSSWRRAQRWPLRGDGRWKSFH